MGRLNKGRMRNEEVAYTRRSKAKETERTHPVPSAPHFPPHVHSARTWLIISCSPHLITPLIPPSPPVPLSPEATTLQFFGTGAFHTPNSLLASLLSSQLSGRPSVVLPNIAHISICISHPKPRDKLGKERTSSFRACKPLREQPLPRLVDPIAVATNINPACYNMKGKSNGKITTGRSPPFSNSDPIENLLHLLESQLGERGGIAASLSLAHIHSSLSNFGTSSRVSLISFYR